MPSQLVMISWNDGDKPFPVDPSYGVPGGGNSPDQSLPLPVFPYDPTVGIDNSLPSQPVTTWPPRPGMKFVVKYLACKGLILVPDNELPMTPEPK